MIEYDENSSWDDFQDTKNKAEVLRFLLALGYNIPQRTLYNHAKTGVLRTNLDGFFTRKLTRKYIRDTGALSTREDISEPSEEITVQRSIHDQERAKWLAKTEKLKYEKLARKLGSKQEFNLQMAARLAVIDNTFRNFIDNHAIEFIALVGGNMEKKDELVIFWVNKLNSAMRELSKPIDYEVIFKSED